MPELECCLIHVDDPRSVAPLLKAVQLLRKGDALPFEAGLVVGGKALDSLRLQVPDADSSIGAHESLLGYQDPMFLPD